MINIETFSTYNEIELAKKMYEKGIIIYDYNSPFFNDICYEYENEYNKDIILEDRLENYYQNITKVCENKCNFSINFNKNEINCTCKIKKIFFDKTYILLYNETKKINYGPKEISIFVLKCYEKVFKWNYFKNNYGSYTILILIILELPAIIIFSIIGLNNAKEFLLTCITMHSNPPSKPKIINEEENKDISFSNENIIKNIINENNKNIKDKENIKLLYKNEYVDIHKEIIDTEDLNYIELFDAVTFDKRNFFKYYYSELIKTQPILEIFLKKTPLMPISIKLILLIFNISITFWLNSFFYSRNYISEKSHNQDNNFHLDDIYDRIIYTCICSIILNLIIKVCISGNRKRIIIWIKREKKPEKFAKEITEMINGMNRIFIIFIIIQEIFMLFFWYYLSCFNNCYKNNKEEWFFTSLICIAIIQVWYFISCLIVSCLRYMGMKCGMESCYNISICLSYD